MNRPTISDDELTRGWNSFSRGDASALVQSTRRKFWQMRLVVGAEITILLTAYAVLAWTIIRGLATPWIVYTAFFAIAGTLALALSIRLRRGTWNSHGTQSTELLGLALQRARAGIALARLHGWGLLVAWVFVAIWTALTWSATAVDSRHEPSAWLLAFGLVGIASLGSAGWTRYYLRRKRREIVRLQAELQVACGGSMSLVDPAEHKPIDH